MIAIKPGANVRRLRPELWDALYKIEPIFKLYDVNLIITSGNDSKHSPGSFHYIDLAVDLRIRHLTLAHAQAVTNKIKNTVGIEYDVILEKDHIHIEFDPRKIRHENA